MRRLLVVWLLLSTQFIVAARLKRSDVDKAGGASGSKVIADSPFIRRSLPPFLGHPP